MAALTEGVSGNHGLRLKVNSSSILVDSTDSEQVLCVFEEPGNVAGKIFALCMHDDPVESVGVTPLHDVVRDLISAILHRWLPTECAGLFCDIADHNTAFTHPRCVWERKKNRRTQFDF